MELQIHTSAGEIAVNIDKRTIHRKKLMAENKIVVIFNSPTRIKLNIGDSIDFKSNRFTLKNLPKERKIAKNRFEYEATFEGAEYRWQDKILRHLGASDFSFSGTANDLIALITDNINEIDYANVQEMDYYTEVLHYNFSNTTCRQALMMVAEATKSEFKFNEKALIFKKSIGTVIPGVTLEYGKGKGLYELGRQQISKVATRIYGYGSTQNIPANYRNGSKRLTFDGGYVDNNTSIYGIIEDSVIFDDVKPQRTGTVTATFAPSPLHFDDSSIDFDLNDHLIDGQSKVVFKSGDLNGNEFEIIGYDHVHKNIRFKANEEESGYIIPNSTVRPEVGDQYTLIGIPMPQSYINTAESEVQTKTAEYAEKVKHPKHSYTLSMDQLVARSKGLDLILDIGDKINVADIDFEVNEYFRVQELSYPLVAPSEITAVLSDEVIYTKTELLRKEIAEQKLIIRRQEKQSAELARVNMINLRVLQNLMIDPDGYFNGSIIKPQSIEAYMLSIGAKSQNFGLNGVEINTNAAADGTKVAVSAGSLIHYEIAIPNVGYVWQMPVAEFTGLVPSKMYYLAAKCRKNTLAGEWIVSETLPLFDQGDDFYYFNLGVIYAFSNGSRGFDFTKGMTFIVGDRITTGIIQSIDGLSFFDLSGNRFNIGDANSSLSWNKDGNGQLVLKGIMVQSQGGALVPLPAYRGVYQSGVTYYRGDEVTFDDGNNTKVYTYINAVASTNAPTNPLFWAVKMDGGTDGTDGTDGNYTEMRFAISASATDHPPLNRADLIPAGWSIKKPEVPAFSFLWIITVVKKADGEFLDDIWSTPSLLSGLQGPSGKLGPAMSFRGWYNLDDNGNYEEKQYYGGEDRVESVYHNGLAYYTRTDAGLFSNVEPTNDPSNPNPKWNVYGLTIESLATGLALINYAVIEKAIVRVVRTNDTLRRIEIDNTTNSIRMNDGQPSNENAAALEIRFDLVDPVQPVPKYRQGIVINELNGGAIRGTTFMTTGGFKSDASNMRRVGGTTGGYETATSINQLKNYNLSEIAAAQINEDTVKSAAPSLTTYAQINDGRTWLNGGVRYKTRRLTGSGNNIITVDDYLVIVTNGNAVLPNIGSFSPLAHQSGIMIIIKNRKSSALTVSVPTGSITTKLVTAGNSLVDSLSIAAGRVMHLISERNGNTVEWNELTQIS